jgi:hypothetical protein
MKMPLMTRILRDCVRREVERALMRDAVVRFSFYECLVKEREVLSSTPRTRYVSEGAMEGMGEGRELMVMNCVWRRDARRVQLARERALPKRQRAPEMQHFWTLTAIPVKALKRESFRSWMDMLGGEPVARLRSSAKPWPG